MAHDTHDQPDRLARAGYTTEAHPHRPVVVVSTPVDRPKGVVALRCPCGWQRIWPDFAPNPNELLDAEIIHRRAMP